MHELALTQAVLNAALRAAKEHEASRILALELSIGAFSDVIPVYVQSCFGPLSAGTIAAGATLRFTRRPARVLCRDCGAQSALTGAPAQCPACGSEALKLLSGVEFTLDAIEAE